VTTVPVPPRLVPCTKPTPPGHKAPGPDSFVTAVIVAVWAC